MNKEHWLDQFSYTRWSFPSDKFWKKPHPIPTWGEVNDDGGFIILMNSHVFLNLVLRFTRFPEDIYLSDHGLRQLNMKMCLFVL